MLVRDLRWGCELVTLSGLAAALWTRSPRDVVAAARRRFVRPTLPARIGAVDATGYHTWLIDELYEFVASQYPADVLERDRFRSLVAQYQNPAWLKATNRYVGDLWSLFAPDFRQHLAEYYWQQDFQLTMTLLSYAANRVLVDAHYIKPYAIARERLGRVKVLELGAGIPHGLLDHTRRDGTSWCTQLTSVDIEGTPARFLAFWCRRHGVTHHDITATAGVAPDLNGVANIDFVFAKDVFEHLTDPALAIERLLACTARRAVLALDLEDKGVVEYQHVSPTLAPLKAAVQCAGFVQLGVTGNLTMFAR